MLVALAGLLLLRFVSGDKIYHLSEVSCKQRCLLGQVDEAGIAPFRRLMAYLHRGLAALPLQLVRHETIRWQLPQELVQAQGLGLVVAKQIEVAGTPAICRKLAGEPFDRRRLRVVRLTHQVKGHLAHQVGPVWL